VIEPRKTPQYKEEVQQRRWYCLHCPDWRLDENSIVTHVRVNHEAEPIAGEDFAMGSQILLLQIRRGQWEREERERFAQRLESLRGADDFEFEVGPGTKEPYA